MLFDYQTEELSNLIIAEAYKYKLVEPGYEPKVYFNTVKNTEDYIKIAIYIGKRKNISLAPINRCIESIGTIMAKVKSDFEVFSHQNNITEKENEEMSKSIQEIEFEKFEAIKKAEAAAENEKYNADIAKEIEEKRQEYLEDQKKANARDDANSYWYFYSGLIEAGFNENQAMQILLAKNPLPYRYKA